MYPTTKINACFYFYVCICFIILCDCDTWLFIIYWFFIVHVHVVLKYIHIQIITAVHVHVQMFTWQIIFNVYLYMNLHNWNDLVYLCSKDSINQRIEILSNKFKNFHEHISNQLSNIQMISVYLPIPKNVVHYKQINVLAKVNSSYQ